MSVDFPRAWQIARAMAIEAHHPECSYRRNDGILLCDCDVLWRHPEYTDDVMQTTDGKPYNKDKKK